MAEHPCRCVFPRAVYHSHLASYEHDGVHLVPHPHHDNQTCGGTPLETQFCWVNPPYFIYTSDETPPGEFTMCNLRSSYYERLTTNGGLDLIVSPCYYPKEQSYIVVGLDQLIDGSGNYLYTLTDI